MCINTHLNIHHITSEIVRKKCSSVGFAGRYALKKKEDFLKVHV